MSSLPEYVGFGGRLWHYGMRALCAAILLFLILPILVTIPLSFNIEPYFSYPMPGFSVRWYENLLEDPNWILATKNTMIVGTASAALATVLGVLAALGLTHRNLPYRETITALLISPMVVPVVIAAVGMYFFYTQLGLSNSLLGLILAHAALGTPFVVITVSATLVGFNENLSRAARSLGANPFLAFWKVKLPIIAPGVVSGAIFAFATSFDEVVVVLFLGGVEQRTIPRQMWSGVREQLSPTILAMATLLTLVSVLLLVSLELLRRRNERMRGMLGQG
ncbi:MAG: ABC transporter permease [Burkholderiaceae bacterium]|nr:ABC transporter permease [Burkholderiaceae bacterium]